MFLIVVVERVVVGVAEGVVVGVVKGVFIVVESAIGVGGTVVALPWFVVVVITKDGNDTRKQKAHHTV